jgi:hypothetical protein
MTTSATAKAKTTDDKAQQITGEQFPAKAEGFFQAKPGTLLDYAQIPEGTEPKEIQMGEKDALYYEYDLPEGVMPPSTYGEQIALTFCKLEGQWYASLCGRLFVMTDRGVHLRDAATVGKYGENGRDADGSHGVRMGISFESLRERGAEFRCKVAYGTGLTGGVAPSIQ